MRALDLSVQLRGCWFDIGVAYALVFDVPVQFGLEFMSVIGANLTDAKWELRNDGIDEVNRVGLIVPVVNLECPNARGVVNRGVLVSLDGFSVFSVEFQKLDVDLYLMTRLALLVSLSMDFPDPSAPRKAAKAISLENAIDTGVGDCDAVVAVQVPHDPCWSQVIGLSKMKHLFNDCDRPVIGRVSWRG